MKEKTKEAKRLLQYNGENPATCEHCKYWLKKMGDTSSTGECTKNESISRYDFRCGNWGST